MKNLISILILFLIPMTLKAQDWQGYGKAISFLIITDGKADCTTCEYKFSFNCSKLFDGPNEVQIIDEETEEYKYSLFLKVGGKNKDSIKLQLADGKILETFYNNTTVPFKNNYLFKQLEFEIYDYHEQLQKRYTVDCLKQLKTYNSEGAKIKSLKLTETQYSNIYALIQKIDVLSLNNCFGENFISHAAKFSFTFTDRTLRKYNYVSQVLPPHLKSIQDLIKNIEG